MTLTKISVVFGVVFILIGILGFIPGITVNGLLLGIFSVNAMHNIVHLVTGVLALLVAKNVNYAKVFFIVFGIIYLIVALMGFFTTGGVVMGMTMNMADNLLHLVVALVALYLGFFYKRLA